MICKYCNNEITDNSRFCGFCGHRLDAAEKQSDTSQSQNTQQEQKTANNSESTSYSNVSFDNATQQTNSKVNEPEINKFFHLTDGEKKVISVFLVIAIFISLGLGYITVAFRYCTSLDTVNNGLEQEYFRDSVVPGDDGKDISVSKHILELMGDYYSEDLGITENNMTQFFMDFDVKKSVANLYYKYFMQFFCMDKTGELTSDDFVDVFRNNPKAVKDWLKTEFDEDDYERLNEAFLGGFFANLATTDVLISEYPLQLTNAVFSPPATWFCVSLLALSACLYLLINDFNMKALLKLIYKNVIAVSFVFTAALIYLKFIRHSVFANPLMWTFLIPIIIASIIIGVRRFKFMIRGFKSKDKVETETEGADNYEQ